MVDMMLTVDCRRTWSSMRPSYRELFAK